MQHLQPNTPLKGGQYLIERMLGQGGFGNTYVGINIAFEEKIAIKEFFMQGINDRDDATGSITVSLERNKPQFEEQLEKFKKEALRIRKLDNPHIVKVHDLFEENGTAYYVMDYIDGENLTERLERTGKPMNESEVRELLPQILDALKKVHDAGIWHLDLKPANIMVDKSGNVRLIDFGASKQLNSQIGGATTSTAIGYTNGYAPREQMEQNYDKFGPWTDIYAFGATLYSLLTNKRPPLPTDIDDDISEDKHQALPFPDNVSCSMKQMVLWMMKTNRNQRPQDIDSILFRTPVLLQKEFVETEDPDEETFLASDESKTDNALENLIQQAEKGDADAQFKLGRLYDKGEGVEEDKMEALKWYEKSADNGNADAQNQLGDWYYFGFNVKRNHYMANLLYLQAAQGNEEARMKTDYFIRKEKIEIILFYFVLIISVGAFFVNVFFYDWMCDNLGKGAPQLFFLFPPAIAVLSAYVYKTLYS